jgi:hypothetical protein
MPVGHLVFEQKTSGPLDNPFYDWKVKLEPFSVIPVLMASPKKCSILQFDLMMNSGANRIKI